jgi:hypothetical protein
MGGRGQKRPGFQSGEAENGGAVGYQLFVVGRWRESKPRISERAFAESEALDSAKAVLAGRFWGEQPPFAAGLLRT